MPKRDDPVDALFRLSLAEFISARKELAARLKKTGYTDEAERVKALAKPPISAWTVNQLYWNHRDEFDELISTGQRFRKAQASGKMANMREALDARRAALSQLSDLATEILSDAGHNPSLDVLRRITTTLEALSSLTTFSDDTNPGRLTQDIHPPGFDSFGAFAPTITTKPTPAKVIPPKKSVAASTKTQPKPAAGEASQREARQARINAAKVSLQNAKKALTSVQAQAKSLEAAQKRAEAAAKEADKQKFHAEERLKKASDAATEAAALVTNIALELAEATEALKDAKRAVENATRNLEASFREAG